MLPLGNSSAESATLTRELWVSHGQNGSSLTRACWVVYCWMFLHTPPPRFFSSPSRALNWSANHGPAGILVGDVPDRTSQSALLQGRGRLQHHCAGTNPAPLLGDHLHGTPKRIKGNTGRTRKRMIYTFLSIESNTNQESLFSAAIPSPTKSLSVQQALVC